MSPAWVSIFAIGIIISLLIQTLRSIGESCYINAKMNMYSVLMVYKNIRNNYISSKDCKIALLNIEGGSF